MKKLVSFALCLVLLVGAFPAWGSFAASAADLEWLTVGESWNGVWDAATQKKYAYLTVSETGFYDLSIEDNFGTGYLTFWLHDLDMDDSDVSVYNADENIYESFDTYCRNNLYLIQDHLYEIECSYEGSYDEGYPTLNANINVLFAKSDYEVLNLTLGNTSNFVVSSDDYEWLKFKTNAAGDYILSTQDTVCATFWLYEKESGAYNCHGSFRENNYHRVSLNANTEYIVKVVSYETVTKLCRASVSKASKNVSKVNLIQNDRLILAHSGYFWTEASYLYWSAIEDFSYKITYSDNTFETLSYSSLASRGIEIGDIVYDGELYSYGDETFFKTGKQPVTVLYNNGGETSSSVYITSYLEWCSSLKIKSDYDPMWISYEGDEEETYYWRIKPNETNNYEFYSYDWDQIESDLTIFDENNIVVPRNDGWNLRAGKEYCLRVSYTYEENCYDDVSFQLEPNRDHIHDSTKKVVTKATTSKNGKISYTCSSCGYEDSSQTIYYPKTFTLSKTSYTYNGKTQKPSVTVKDSKGKTISSSNYTVSYSGGCKDPGTYKVTVTMKGNYSGTKTLTYKINPIDISKCKITLSKTEYTYNGKTQKPTVTVKTASGTKLTTSSYTVTYASGCKNVGKYKVTIKMKGNYTGTKTLYFTINPVKTSISKLSGGSKSLTVTWSKKSSQVTGYEIQYSTSKNFSGAKTATVKSYKTTKATIKNLKAKTTYYVRVRTYKTVDGKKYYSGWSTVKYTKIK